MKKPKIGNRDWCLKYRGITRKLFYCFLAQIFLFLSACQNPYTPKSIPGGKGSVTLIVDGADARTISPNPDQVTIAAYTINFFAPGTSTVLETEDRTPANLSTPFLVIPRTYDIQVTAYKDESKKQAVAQGEIKGINVVEGTNITRKISLNFIVTPSSEGTFRWKIGVPAGLTSASMTITPVDAGTGTAEITRTFTGTTTFADSLTLKTGYYLVVFELEKPNTQKIVFREFLHVFANLESFLGKEFTDDHFNNIKYTVTFDFDNGTTPLPVDCLHGEKVDYHSPGTKQTPAGLYVGTPPENCTFDKWYNGSNPWDFDKDIVTGDMTLNANWNSGRIESVAENKVAAAVGYINDHATSGGAYTLLMGADDTVSSAISLMQTISLTIKGQSTRRTITLSGGNFMVANNAQLTIGSNITFAGSGEINIGRTLVLSLSGDAVVQKLTLWADNSECSYVNIGPDWKGSVTTLNLKGNSTELGTVSGYWLNKTVLQNNVTPATVGNFKTVNFINSSGTTRLITAANPPDAPAGYTISTEGADIGKLVALSYAARSGSKEYLTLYAAITDSTLLNGSVDKPTEIIILRNITVPESDMSANTGYTIPNGKHIKLTVESGQTRTITASAGNFSLFRDNYGSVSLTLDGGGGTLILNGNKEAAEFDRQGINMSGETTLIMNNGVIITGFYSNYGGVYLNSATSSFTMSGGKITGNTGNGLGGGLGGGVHSRGTFTMSGGEISGNKASSGGGVFNGGTFTMSGGEISGNEASSGGGGVSTQGTFTMSGGEISGNTVNGSSGGGGVQVLNATFNMNGGKISGNIVSSNGGGVTVSGNFNMYGGEISNNTANGTTGGGGGVYMSSGTRTFTMSGGDIMNNTAATWGGGVYVNSGNTFTMSGGTIYGTNEADISLWNNAPNGSAALYNGGTATFSGDYGGGMYVAGDTIATTNDTLPGTPRFAARIGTTGYATLNAAITAATGTADNPIDIIILRDIVTGSNGEPAQYNIKSVKYIRLLPSGNRTITFGSNISSSLFDINNTTQDGSFILGGTGGNLTLNGNNDETGNYRRAISFYGGALVMNSGVTITGFKGGGIFVGNSAPTSTTFFTMYGGEIKNNSTGSNGDGGGVLLGNINTKVIFTMYSGEIKNNSAGSSGNGGGVYVNISATFNMNGGEIKDNNCSQYRDGGGVYVYTDGTFNMSGGKIKNNTAGRNGGGVFVSSNATFTMSGGTIYGIDKPLLTNKSPSGAASDQGAALYNYGTASYSGDYTIFGSSISSGATNTTIPPILNVEFDMEPISTGTFLMGSPADEPGRTNANETQHSVTLTKSFHMGKYQVTQEQYQAVMGKTIQEQQALKNDPNTSPTDDYGRGNKNPIYCVSWYDAIVFCNRLSIMEGLNPVYSIGGKTNPTDWGAIPTSKDSTWNEAEMDINKNGYRLPTEAEWEYACRAGTTTAFNNGNNDNLNTALTDEVGWYSNNSGNKTHEVGSKRVNAWGLYDMHGNVFEWCWDWFGQNYYSSSPTNDPLGATSLSGIRVIRGGDFNNPAASMRSAYRSAQPPETRGRLFGFRLVRTVTTP